MRFVRVLALVGAITGGFIALSGAPASAAPVPSGALAATAVGEPLVTYAQSRRYRHRYYAPRRTYRRYRPYYRPYYRPRVVCHWRYTRWGRERVCYRRW
jgi:hypothetical protein